MEIIDLVFQGYFLLLFLRLTISGTGQAAFNRIFQFIVKATDPVVRPLERIFPVGGRSVSLWVCLGLLIFLRGLLFLSAIPESLVFDFHVAAWSFNRAHGLWWLARSLVYYFVFVFQIYAFALAVHKFWPVGTPGEESKRLVAFTLAPLRLDRWGWGGLLAAFSVLLAVVWAWFLWTGIIIETATSWWAAPVLAVVLVVRLIRVAVYLIIAAVVLRWLRMRSIGGWRSYGLESLAEVFLSPFRPLKLQVGNFDLTPLVAILVFLFARQVLMELLVIIYHAL